MFWRSKFGFGEFCALDMLLLGINKFYEFILFWVHFFAVFIVCQVQELSLAVTNKLWMVFVDLRGGIRNGSKGDGMMDIEVDKWLGMVSVGK